jgi:hypothetical protein
MLARLAEEEEEDPAGDPQSVVVGAVPTARTGSKATLHEQTTASSTATPGSGAGRDLDRCLLDRHELPERVTLVARGGFPSAPNTPLGGDAHPRRPRTTMGSVVVPAEGSHTCTPVEAGPDTTWGLKASPFPLLLVGSTILGFSLRGNPHLRHDILSSAVGEFAVIGGQLDDPRHLGGGTADPDRRSHRRGVRQPRCRSSAAVHHEHRLACASGWTAKHAQIATSCLATAVHRTSVPPARGGPGRYRAFQAGPRPRENDPHRARRSRVGARSIRVARRYGVLVSHAPPAITTTDRLCSVAEPIWRTAIPPAASHANRVNASGSVGGSGGAWSVPSVSHR